MLTFISIGKYISVSSRTKVKRGQTTCALLRCPDFNQPIKAGAHCLIIERGSNLHLADKVLRPSANLAAVRASAVGTEFNLRGRGETGCFQFHVACGEYVLIRGAYTDRPASARLPTASLPLGDFENLIWVELNPSKVPGYQSRLGSPRSSCNL